MKDLVKHKRGLLTKLVGIKLEDKVKETTQAQNKNNEREGGKKGGEKEFERKKERNRKRINPGVASSK